MEINTTYDRSLIEKLLPHRPPFLLVDSITSYFGGRYPSMNANFSVNKKEPAHSGSISGSHWPSIYIIEGMGQCCNLVIIISALEKGLMKAGFGFETMDGVLKGLMYDKTDEITLILKGILKARQEEVYSNVGFLGSANVEVTGYVRHGQVITYEVRLNQSFGILHHSTVRAFADDNPVAHGTLISAAGRE